MPRIHFICPERANLHQLERSIYESGDWDVKTGDAARLVGGMIYLHKTKASPSYFGGRIDSWRIVDTDNAHRQRVIFRFLYLAEGRNQRWPTGSNPRAWTTGVLEE